MTRQNPEATAMPSSWTISLYTPRSASRHPMLISSACPLKQVNAKKIPTTLASLIVATCSPANPPTAVVKASQNCWRSVTWSLCQCHPEPEYTPRTTSIPHSARPNGPGAASSQSSTPVIWPVFGSAWTLFSASSTWFSTVGYPSWKSLNSLSLASFTLGWKREGRVVVSLSRREW